MFNRCLMVVVLLVSVVAPAWGQVGRPNPFTFPPGPITQPPPNVPHPLNNPHPAESWDPLGSSRPNYGDVVRYIPVPPQQVSISLYVPVPDGIPPQTRQETVEIPGYYVAETTTGYYYPERWTLQQMNVGVYQWVKLPPEFRRK